MAESTSASLLERLRDGRGDADWRRFYDLYSALLFQWLRTHRVPESDHDDLVADLLALIVAKIPQFSHSGQTGSFRSWLRRMLVFRVREYWRNRANRPADLAVGGEIDFRLEHLCSDDHELSRRWDDDHDRHIIARLLDTIRPEFPQRTWDAFERTALQNRPPDEVARELSMTVNAVYLCRAKVLRRLRSEGAGLIDT
jgi:RNA polymerase sigma factor (sigma-70 family)